MPHVFVDPAECHDDRVVLTGDVAHHLLTVLRLGRGHAVDIADGTGMLRRAVIGEAGSDRAVCRVTSSEMVHPPEPSVRVVCALPKGRKLDEVVQRLTELGVDEIVPAHSARTQVRLDGVRADRAHRRWEAVARAAAQQCRRVRLPTVSPVTTWTAAFATDGADGVVFWEEATSPLRAVPVDGWRAVTVAVGPEGGLTADEVAATGLPAVSLGPTILRTETAGVVAPALVLHRTGRLG